MLDFLADFRNELIAAAVGVLGAGATVWIRRRDEKSEKVKELLGLYRDPLLAAAFDLQSRFYNIFRGGFLEAYHDQGEGVNRTYAEDSTLWIIGQYLGWAEILRREVLFLDLGKVEKNKRLQRHLDDVTRAFASDVIKDRHLRIFSAHQRAIGEVMIVEGAEGEEASRTHCVGYSEFKSARTREEFKRWFEPLALDLTAIKADPRAHSRIVSVQRALIDLIDLLDRDFIRYPKVELRGKLPRVDEGPPAARPWVTRFKIHPAELDGVFGPLRAWAVANEMTVRGPAAGDAGSAKYRAEGSPGLTSMRFTVELDLDLKDLWISLNAYLSPLAWQRRVWWGEQRVGLRGRRWPVSRWRARRRLNALLAAYDRPPLLRSWIARRLRG